MAMSWGNSFENFVAYRYLKPEKFRTHIFVFSLVLLLSFGLTALFSFLFKNSASTFIIFLKSHYPYLISFLFFVSIATLILFVKIRKRFLLVSGGFILIFSLPLMVLSYFQLFEPEYVPRIGFYLLYYYAFQATLGVLVMIFGSILFFFNVHSTTSIFSVFLGTTTMVVVLSVLSGLEGEQKNQILGFSPHITITKKQNEYIQHYKIIEERLTKLMKQKGVKSIMAPFTEEEVLVKSSAFEATQGIILRGINPDAPTFDLEKYMKSGTINNLKSKERVKWVDPTVSTTFFMDANDPVAFLPTWPVDSPGIILSQEQAKTLGISLGKLVDVISPRGTMSPTGPIPKLLRFRVAGIYSTKQFKYDLKYAFVTLQMAQTFSSNRNSITGWDLRINDTDKIDNTASYLKNNLDSSYKVETWKTRNKALFNAMKLEKFVMFIILVVIILVAAFSITANLIMVVMDKKQEIAILKSQGANNFSVRKIFILQGVMIGIIGLILGLIFGLLICLYLANIGFKTSENIFVLARIPVSVGILDIVSITFSAIVLSMLATLYPSWKATKISPVEGLNDIE